VSGGMLLLRIWVGALSVFSGSSAMQFHPRDFSSTVFGKPNLLAKGPYLSIWGGGAVLLA